jgi:hypothetical protein
MASLLPAVWAVAAIEQASCAQPPSVDDETLQALLHDEPIAPLGPERATVSRHARSSPPGPSVVPPTADPLAAWDFDECTSQRTELIETFGGNFAFRSVGAACTDGVEGQGVAIANRGDMIYVPDQPAFTFEGGVTVAGWFKPTATGGTRSLLRKRDLDSSSFVLLLHRGKFQFVVHLGDGRAASVTSPAAAVVPGVFQHVAGSYDGSVLRLYVGGREVASSPVVGTVVAGPGPMVMANDGSERRFDGVIDGVLLAAHALTADEVLQLTCSPQPPSVVVTPGGALAALPRITTRIDVAVTNVNPAACAPVPYEMVVTTPDFIGLDLQPFQTNPQSGPVPSGGTTHFTITATPNEFVEPGTEFPISFDVFTLDTSFFVDFESVTLHVIEPPGCRVSTGRELMITNTEVVDDPVRTSFDPTSSDPRNGVWTFKHLIEAMAPSSDAAPAMVEAMLTGFTRPMNINGFTVDARPGMHSLVIDRWPRTPDGALDLGKAPLRLQAIVNRFDLRDPSHGDAGEGRFVFAFNNPDFPDFPLSATMIFEYKLPATTDADVLEWGQSFHALGALPFGESYNAALQQITERFVRRGARPGQINGSAIDEVRTNEIAFATDSNFNWQMRAFELSPTSGLLVPAPLPLTPDRSFNRTATLASYITANQAAILAEQHTVPARFAGAPFQAGAVLNDLSSWFAPGVDSEARHHFALNTCNGCHSNQETGTEFLQIEPRLHGDEARLSRFLTGITVFDPGTGRSRRFNDLGRRNLDLKAIVCAGETASSLSPQ